MLSQSLFGRKPLAYSGGLRVLLNNSEENKRISERYKLRARQATPVDVEGMLAVEKAAWEPTRTVVFEPDHFTAQMVIYPQGQLVLEVEDREEGTSKIVGVLNSRKGDKSEISRDMTWEGCADGGFIRNHNPKGKILFPINESFLPTAESLGGIGLLEGAMIALAVSEGCEAIVFGSRIPRLAAFNCKMLRRRKPRLTGLEYATMRKPNGRFYDPLIAKFMSVPFMEFVEVLHGYYDDPESENYAALMACHNPLYLYHLGWLYKGLFAKTIGRPVIRFLEKAVREGA